MTAIAPAEIDPQRVIGELEQELDRLIAGAGAISYAIHTPVLREWPRAPQPQPSHAVPLSIRYLDLDTQIWVLVMSVIWESLDTGGQTALQAAARGLVETYVVPFETDDPWIADHTVALAPRLRTLPADPAAWGALVGDLIELLDAATDLPTYFGYEHLYSAWRALPLARKTPPVEGLRARAGALSPEWAAVFRGHEIAPPDPSSGGAGPPV